jgi:uncharacterized phage protein (predicted DNA packaging)
MHLVDLAQTKQHLRIEHTDEDALLDFYIEAASDYVLAFTQTSYDADTAPAMLKAATLLLIGDLFENREGCSQDFMKRNPTLTRLLWLFREFH